MDVNVLRSRLVFLLGEELKNLTATDLKECTFRTSRLVFSSIVFAGRTLQEEAERLSIVNDSRVRKLALLRNQTDSREERKRVEEEYRHVFFEVILKALLDLQFPPALEPFSDPLSSLKDDTEFRLAAMQYLLDNAVVGTGSLGDNMSCLSVQNEDSSRHNNSIQSSREDFTMAELSAENHCLPSSSSKTKQRQRPSSRDPPPPSTFPSSHYPPPPATTTTTTNSSNHPTVAVGSPRHERDQNQDHNQNQQDSDHCQQRDNGAARVDAAHSLCEYDTLCQSYEILQHHNEQLSKQLKALQGSVCQRNAMEVKMDLLMRDFSSMISEIADISSSPSGDAFDPPPQGGSSHSFNATPSTPPTKQKNVSRPLGAVLEEASSTRRKRPVSGSSGNNGTNIGSGGAASTVHWKQLQARIQDVHTRWKSMRREAKRSVLASVSVHASTSCQARDGYSSVAGRQGSRSMSTSRSSVGSSTSTSTSIGRRDNSAAPRSSGRSFTPTNKKSAFGGGMSMSQVNINYNEGPVPVACASLHKILGIHLPLSFHDEDDASYDTSHNGQVEVSLDVPRVHQLQRDLLTFSRHAYSFSQLCEIGDDTSSEGALSSLDAQKQDLQRRLSRSQSLQQMRQTSRALLLHTACLSPLLPLACASPALSSSASGLDALLELTQPMLEAKKLWSSTLQAAFDRAKSEQYSLLVAVTHSDMRMKRWQTLAGQLHPLLSNFADKLSSHCESAVQQVQERRDSLQALADSLAQAEGVRMALPQSNSSLVSPLEALCRGYFGEEIADLMNRLRISGNDISRLSSSIQSVQKQMMTDIGADVSMLMQCGDSMSELSTV